MPAATPVQDVAQSWDPGATFSRALAALVGAGQSLADLAIWLLVVALPVLLGVVLVLWLALRVAPLVRRRLPATPAAEE